MGLLRTLIATLVWVSVVSVGHSQQRTPAAVAATVQGILQRGEFLGPPNYENPRTDRREQWFYLQLPAPFQAQNPRFRLGVEFERPDEYFVQLHFDGDGAKQAAQFIGRKVRVTGTPEAAVIAHDRTGITLDVRMLVQVQDWNW